MAMFAAVSMLADETSRFILPNRDELLWGSVAFGLLLFLMLKYVFPPMQKILAQRTQRIRESIESADRAKGDAERLLDEYRQQLAEARGESQKIIDEAKRTAEAMRQDLVRRA